MSYLFEIVQAAAHQDDTNSVHRQLMGDRAAKTITGSGDNCGPTAKGAQAATAVRCRHESDAGFHDSGAPACFCAP